MASERTIGAVLREYVGYQHRSAVWAELMELLKPFLGSDDDPNPERYITTPDCMEERVPQAILRDVYEELESHLAVEVEDLLRLRSTVVGQK